ncbi:MAG: flippase-like domain-containing protein [Planctomycetota bacterium]|nr:flippase-like domain-containing protein [Planctomycetota bacterium]MDR1520118.1 flippase-like domain-containing protein [Planctomycetota bacterium]
MLLFFMLSPGTLWRLLGHGSWNVHRICFAAFLVALVALNPLLRPDAGILSRVFDNWLLSLLGCGISFTQPFLGALRLHRLLGDRGIAMSLFATFRLCLAGTFFNIFLPGSTGGDAYRVYALGRGLGTGFAPALASITLDRVLGFPSLILVVLLGMGLNYRFLLGNSPLTKLVPFVAAAGVVCLGMVFYLAWAGRGGGANPDPGKGNPRSSRPGRLRRLHLLIAGNVRRPATLPLALIYGGLSHLATIASCQCFALALGVSGLPWMRYYLIIPLAMTINAIPGAPGGLGQGELAMAALLGLADPGGINPRAGVALMLLFRLSNLFLGLIGGADYALGGLKKRAGSSSAER